MSEHVKEINDVEFNNTIASGVTLVDFWAPWCGPCRMQGPILDQLAEEIDGKAVIAKINIDDNPNTATKFGVRSIPTLLLFKDGEVSKQFVGVQRKETLADAIRQVL